MENYFIYLLKVSACLILFYFVYVLFFKKEIGFKAIRFFLITSVLLSFSLPFVNFSISFPKEIAQQNIQETSPNVNSQPVALVEKIENNYTALAEVAKDTSVDYTLYFTWVYIFISIVILIRVFAGIIFVLVSYVRSTKEMHNGKYIYINDQLSNSFSFFRLIFINTKELTKKEIEGIITHENIHVSQYHTIDLMLVELLSAVMWFNPVVWLFRKSLRQVHEYLADEGVLNIGFDRLEYQTLLINQVAESRLLNLASSFNHSQIKNRILMMTKLKSGNNTKVKLFALIPVTLILFLAIACVNGQSTDLLQVPPPPPPPVPGSPPPPPPVPDSTITAVAASRMNVLYIGIDNPIEISSFGLNPDQIEVKIDNGTIEGSKGQYIVIPKELKNATITVSANGKVIKTSAFRVKLTPDPVAAIVIGNTYKKGGSITKKELLEANGVQAIMENFDFDLKFMVSQFTLSLVIDAFSHVNTSPNGKFTEEQKSLIKQASIGQKVYIENIKAIGPDGFERSVGTLAFTIAKE